MKRNFLPLRPPDPQGGVRNSLSAATRDTDRERGECAPVIPFFPTHAVSPEGEGACVGLWQWGRLLADWGERATARLSPSTRRVHP